MFHKAYPEFRTAWWKNSVALQSYSNPMDECEVGGRKMAEGHQLLKYQPVAKEMMVRGTD